ncbi:carbon-nitrogen hydrolase family protein, partial [Pseudomonas sp. CrR25]|nr:carbon-nitrogen hydrolase family protein [Pseudomonas sp. CrR25]
MRRLLKLGISLMLLASLGSYLYWAEQRPPLGHLLSDLRSQVVLDQGTPRDRGNLLGIQPELVASDYHSSARLRLKLAAHLDKARHDGLLNRKTIVVLPAHIGTLLVATGEKPELYKATNFDQALAWLSVSHPLELPRALLQATGEARLSEALLRIKAPQMARDYQQLFSGLAAQFGITLVAGSVVLPEPRLDDGQLLTGNGPLHNVSLVFGADGAVLGHLQRQNLPSPEGWLFSGAADADLWHSIDTPAGRLGVLIDA